MPQQLGPAYGRGGGVGAYEIATKPDGNPAVFSTVTAMKQFYTSIAKPGDGQATAIGTVDASGQPLTLTAAYTWKGNKWVPIATNFRGSPGKPGKSGAGFKLSGFKDGEIPIVDQKTNSLVESGIFAEKGELTVEPDSIIMGGQEISSSGETLVFTHLTDQKIYIPIHQELTPTSDALLARKYDKLERVNRYTGTTRRYTNPEFDVLMDEDQTTFSIITNLFTPATNVVMDVFLGKVKVYRATWDSIPQGETSLALKTPGDFLKGRTYSVKFYSLDGDITLRGGGRGPRWSVDRAKWVEVPVATQHWVRDRLALRATETIPWGLGSPAPFNVDPLDLSGINPTIYKNKLLQAAGTASQSVRLPDITTAGLSSGDRISFENNIKTGHSWIRIAAFTGNTIGADTVVSVPEEGILILEVPDSGTSWTVVKQPVFMSAGVQSDAAAPTEKDYLQDKIRPITSIMADKGVAELVDSPDGGSALVFKHSTANPVVKISLLDSGDLSIVHADGSANKIVLPTNGKGNPIDLQSLKAEVYKLEAELQSQGTDISTLKGKIGNLEHSLDDLEGTYTYAGRMLPTYPDKAMGRYFITLKGQAAREAIIDIPSPSMGSLSDGTILYVSNENAKTVVKVTPEIGETINGASEVYTVPPLTHILLIKDGKDWKVGLTSSISTSSMPLTSDMLTRALDKGTYTGSGSIKSLDDGWWVIPATNVDVTGRPKGTSGDLNLIKQTITGSITDPRHGMIIATGLDSEGDPTMWVSYRDGLSWTPWLITTDNNVIKDITTLKTGEQALVAELASLKTEVGNIYAPSKAAFDTEATHVVTAQLAAFKAELLKEGWGVLPKVNPTPGGTTTIPVYGQFGDEDYPQTIDLNARSDSGKITLSKSSDDPKYAYIVIPIAEANRVKGIGRVHSLHSLWSSKDLTILGRSFRVFRSPHKLYEKSVTYQVYV